MSTPIEQDTADPNSLLYYAPRRLRDRADALRTIDGSPVLAPDAPVPELQDHHAHPDPLPRISRVPKRETMEALWRRNQRARKKQVFAPVLRFAAVASVAAAIAFTYVIMTELPDQNTGKEVTSSAPKIATGASNASVNETTAAVPEATNPNPDDVIILKGSSASAAASAPPDPQPTPTRALETTGSRESSAPISFEQFQQFLLWQQTMAQASRQEPSVRQAPATRDPAPRRKRKARRSQTDDDE